MTTPIQRHSRERLVFQPGRGPAGDVLITIFLRGGMDGLFVVPPYADPRYFVCRPRQRKLAPGHSGGMTDLDGFFALHPWLASLNEPFRAKHLAIVHASGSPDDTLSHFHATQTMECGAADDSLIGNGWLARHLASHNTDNTSPMRALAFGNVLPLSLRGAPQALAVRSTSELRLVVPPTWPKYATALDRLYTRVNDAVSQAGQSTLRLLKDLERLHGEVYQPAGRNAYPASALGQNLKQVAQLIKAEVGLEVACLESHGWDSHLDTDDYLRQPMRSLAASLQAFYQDLEERLSRVVVVVLSEFGRRAAENSALGTDHGRGTAMFVLGGRIRGGKVYGAWPGLGAEDLDGDGNVRVTTDYRNILAEIVERRLGNSHIAAVFPKFAPRYLDLAIPGTA